MLRAPRPAARWTGFAFFFTSAFFAIKLWCDSAHAFPIEIRMVIGVTAMTSVGWFWLMVMALFEDVDEFRPVMFAAPAGLFLFGIANQFPSFNPVIWTGSMLLQAGLAIAALVMVLRSWKNDLVESRRQIRGPFMIAVSLYILSLNGFDIWEMIGDTPAWYPMLNAAMLTLCVMAGAFAFLEARGAMFGEAEQVLPAPHQPTARPNPAAAEHASGANGLNGGSAAALDRAAKADLDRLEMLMSTQQVWKEEGLTIAGLAIRSGMPESQLRRLINDCLGYRNFPSYVNAHRIAAAKSRLADPSEARVSISAIAYDIGFASLGPFNRAFREETGVAPSEWRRSALHEPSPIPEKV